jgi:pimeloyl-ACP methyl ester carboxylesterase
MNPEFWQEANINGAELQFLDYGNGEPVVFVHGGMGRECSAVLAEPMLAGFRIIHFQRRGYGGSSRAQVPGRVAQNSADCLELLRQLRVPRAHLVGQSFGAVVVLQTILDAPQIVHSAVLIEPPLPSLMAEFPDFTKAAGQAAGLYKSGNKRAALEVFAKAVIGEGVSDVARKFRDEYIETWTLDADTVFQSDLSALGEWKFTEQDIRRINQPVLNVRGSETPPLFREAHARLNAWLPNVESVVVPLVSHPVLQMDPPGMAERITRFCREHPIPP